MIWTPLLPYMVKIVKGIVREGAAVPQELSVPQYLDSKLVTQPSAALQLVGREVIRCASITDELLKNISQAVRANNSRLLDKIMEQSGQLRKLNEHITEYLADLFSAGSMTEEQANGTARLMYLLGDLERIAFLGSEIADALQTKIEKKYKYSKDAMKDLEKCLSFIEKMYAESLQIMISGNMDGTQKIMKKKEKVFALNLDMRKAHMHRVSKGKCSAKLTTPFHNILNTLDRLSNNCVNIADAVAEQADRSADFFGNIF